MRFLYCISSHFFCHLHFRHVLTTGLSRVAQIHICASDPFPDPYRQQETNPYSLFAAYLHTMPLEELLKNVEHARRDAQLKYVVIYGAACSYCLGRAERLDGSYLRTFALELKEQLAQTLATFVTSILAGPHGGRDTEETAGPRLPQIIEVSQQVMCTHDAEKLAISVLEIYEVGSQGGQD